MTLGDGDDDDIDDDVKQTMHRHATEMAWTRVMDKDSSGPGQGMWYSPPLYTTMRAGLLRGVK